ncbi:MAG: hypothetical protein KAU22_09015 [Desulfuromonadales bacterium]|nr:hypothetical protein [Desulfuromonadales bacterium]
MSKITILSLLLMFSTFTGTTTVLAALEVHPRMMIEEEYNDNIFLNDITREEDWITTVEPGISFNYDNRSVTATVDYSLRYRFYKNHDEQNQDEFKNIKRANADVQFFSGRPFTLRLTEVISREVVDESERNTEYNELINHTTVYHTTATPEYRLQLVPTLSLVMGGSYDRFDYVYYPGDYEEYEGRVSLVKQLSSSTEVFARYAYVVHITDANADEFDRQNYTLGITQQLGGRTTISAEGGYSEIEYDIGYKAHFTNGLVDITYQLSEPVTISLAYSHDFNTTIEDGLREIREASIGASYNRDSLIASTEVFWNESDYFSIDRNDEVYGVRCDFTRSLARALSINIDAEYERAEFVDFNPDSDEVINRLTIGTSLDYEYNHFLASLGYRYRINESDLDGNDYDNNIVTLSVTVRF